MPKALTRIIRPPVLLIQRRRPAPVLVVRGAAGLSGLGAAVTLPQSVKQSIGSTIQTVEGWFPGSVSYTDNNPGNLKYVGQAGATGADSRGFAVFPDYATGQAALYHQLDLYAGQGLTIGQMMNIYAPATDGNQPGPYAQNIANAVGATVNTKLTDLGGGQAAAAPPPDAAPDLGSSDSSIVDIVGLDLSTLDPTTLAIFGGLAAAAVLVAMA